MCAGNGKIIHILPVHGMNCAQHTILWYYRPPRIASTLQHCNNTVVVKSPWVIKLFTRECYSAGYAQCVVLQ